MARDLDAAILKVAGKIGNVIGVGEKKDRSVALVGVSFLNAHLGDLLRSFMVEDFEEVDSLLGSESPLGAFGPRIRTAYCLGLISGTERDDLRAMSAIGDYFSSKMSELKFTDEKARLLCNQLKLPRKIIPKGQTQTPRRLFVFTVSLLVHELSLRIRQAEDYRRQLAGELNLVELGE